MLTNKKVLICLIAIVLSVSSGFALGRISKEFEITSENLAQRSGTFQLWGGSETITVSVGLDNEFWYSAPGEGEIANTFSCELDPIDDYLFLINSDKFIYDLVSVEKDYLILIDTDKSSVMKISKISDTPTMLSN